MTEGGKRTCETKGLFISFEGTEGSGKTTQMGFSSSACTRATP